MPRVGSPAIVSSLCPVGSMTQLCAAAAATAAAPKAVHVIHVKRAQERPQERAQKRPAIARCSGCSMRGVCMPADLTASQFAQLDSIICATRPVQRGDALYRTNDEFESIYAVRLGSFKTVVMHRDGREQVTGFQIAGEALGLDGICSGHHNGDAIALEDSVVCVIPFTQLETVCREIRSMQHHVHQIMSSEIVRESTPSIRMLPAEGS